MTLLIDGENQLGDVCDDLIAFRFPQGLDADLKVFNQNLLERGTTRPGRRLDIFNAKNSKVKV